MRIDTRSLRLVRWQARLPQLAFFAAVGLLCAVCLRGLLSTDAGAVERVVVDRSAGDARFQAFAEAFARAYLEWDAEHPEEQQRAVSRFASTALEPGAGFVPPDSGRQHVTWSRAIGAQRRGGERLVTVVADTSNGPVDLAVPVAQDRRGMLYVSRYPSLLGPSPADTTAEPSPEPPVDDGELRAVARRTVVNFLSGQRANLLADLDRGALVVVPSRRLAVRGVRDVTWAVAHRRVAVVVEARAQDGSEMTLRYELDVVRRAGRWLVRTVSVNPVPKEERP